MNRGDRKKCEKEYVLEAAYFTAEYRETRCISQTSGCQFKTCQSYQPTEHTLIHVTYWYN